LLTIYKSKILKIYIYIMTTPFWSNDPSIIFNKDSMLQVWPTANLTFEGKLNAISRTVIVLSFLGFLFTRKAHFLIIGAITLAIIVSLYKFRKEKIVKDLTQNIEGFQVGGSNQPREFIASSLKTTNPVTLETLLRSDFHPTTKKNPFGNVLLTDIMDQPDRQAAAPSFNPDVYDDINSAVKKQTQMLNPSIINTNKQLYGDLYDSYTLDNSMMRFYSTANTRVTSDQGSFSQYLYGNMYSGKESTPEGAMMRVKDNVRYINL
jgi:hypothetical protein